MGRRAQNIGAGVVRDVSSGGDTPSPENARADTMGGTPGVLAQQQASTTIHMTPGGNAGQSFHKHADTPDVPVRQFRVRNGGTVMMGGIRLPIRVGKLVNEQTYDLKALRDQGIQLDEIKDEAPPALPVTE